jgi:hypothetical protein
MKRFTEYALIALTIITLTAIWGLTYHYFGWYGIITLAVIAIGLSIYTTI